MSIIDTFNNIGDDLMSFKDNFVDIFTNPRLRNILIFVFIIFFSISVYIYFKFIHSKLNLTYVPNSEFISKKEDKLVVLWFYTDWCPYCKSTYYEWTTFKSSVENKKFHIPIEFREINCDKDETLANKYNIKEYPSVRIVYKDQTYVYDADPDSINLMEFLKGSLPPPPVNLQEISNDLKDTAKVAILGHD